MMVLPTLTASSSERAVSREHDVGGFDPGHLDGFRAAGGPPDDVAAALHEGRADSLGEDGLISDDQQADVHHVPYASRPRPFA